ncbi:hypothetical protein [Motilimonas sp. KMU-193]|uniref:hypothetical protein n=1 Tax=Motilimonas sp. KMU-193 TaxID=3388668 RepID=UPI00396B372F
MKLAKRQARAKNKKQKYNQQKALKAQQLAARKLNANRPVTTSPAVVKTSTPKVEEQVTNQPVTAQSSEEKQQEAVKASDISADKAIINTAAFTVTHPIETITAIEKAIAKDEFTPTLLGKLFDVGAVNINNMLEKLGLQEAKETGKSRAVSTKGEAYLAKAKAAGLTWKFAVVEQLASLDDLMLDQQLCNQEYRRFALAQ